jgi:N-acetylneuraminic acid mutarotase
MMEVRSEATITLLNDGRVLVAGGQFFGVGTAELYDPNSGTWSTTGSMTAGRIGHTATLLPDGTVLAVGGYTNDTSGNFATQLASAELYDPASGTWTPAGSMLEAHIDHTATLLLNGTVLVAGGTSELGPAGAELYDPAAATWVGAPSTIEARSGHLATILADGRVLVAGGSNSTGPLTSAELYDPGTGT